MMRRIICLFVFLTLFVTHVQADPVLQDNSAAIIDFSTPVTVVNRATLRQRLVRMPVSWQTINRPLTANLYFEQVFPDGSAINVELPRLIPWVRSSGEGIAAPIEPPAGINEIVLRVALRDFFSQQVYSERQFSVRVGNTGDPPSDIGFVPTITRFTASSTAINRTQLQDGSARIGVTWQTINRPITTNLIFEQVLSPGVSVNVELPRENSWVNSSGTGVVAPVDPGNGSQQVWLRVRFVDRLNGRVHDQRDAFVTIIDPPRPARIESFVTGVTSVDGERLQQGIERTPVNWRVVNRPANSNLVFEQILTNGSVVNVELPRPNPIVPSSGTGIIAPVWPGGNATQVRLQVRLIDLGTGAFYDRKEIVLPIIQPPPQPDFFITHFSSSANNVNMGRLLGGMERVQVTWALNQRPANTNLVFEQRMLNGTLRNIELPRPNPMVPSSGSGVVAPVWPGNQAQFITLVIRLVNLTTNATLDSAELTLPIVGTQGSGVQYGAACFNAPYGPNRGFQVSDQARAVVGDVANGLRVRNLPQGDFVETLALGTTFDIIEGPACWTIQTFAPGQSHFRVWRIRTHQHNLEAWIEEYRVESNNRLTYYIQEIQDAPAPVPIINSFSANPSTVQPGGTTTLSWNVAQASTVMIQVYSGNGQALETHNNLPMVGTLNSTPPANAVTPLSYVLSASSADGTQTQSQNLIVHFDCPFTDPFLQNECPTSQSNIQAAFQTFENGVMFWRGDTRQIYVLYNGGTYDVYTDTWTADQPVDTGETPPPGLILPARGFGKVWANEGGVRDRIGWATGSESSYSTKLETYNLPGQGNGIVVNIPDGRILSIAVSWQTL